MESWQIAILSEKQKSTSLLAASISGGGSWLSNVGGF